jgi:hypothetical protein
MATIIAVLPLWAVTALRTGRKLYWNNAANLFENDKEASRFIKPDYQGQWNLPKV